MKQNAKSLTFFTVRETIQCFLKKGTGGNYIEEGDVSNYIL